MINVKELVLNKDFFIKKFNDKGYDLEKEVDKVITLYKDYQKKLTIEQEIRTKLNTISKQIKSVKENENLKKEAIEISKKAKQITSEVNDHKKEIDLITSFFPNPSSDEVPVGKDENDNVVISTHWDEFKNKENSIPHWEFLDKKGYSMSDESGSISGTRQVIYKGKLALLVKAVERYMIEKHVSNDIELIEPPVIVNKEALFNTGQLPKFEEDLYKLENGQYLIPTAEVPLTNLVANKIISLNQLPIKFVAITNCFRQEAGAAGKDTRGLIRLHQFRKVELVTIGDPLKEDEDFNQMLEQSKSILDDLRIPYRIVLLSTGDSSFTSRKTYDIEVWMPGVKQYREISSISSIGDFQSRRMKTRIDLEEGKKFAYTYNGSALAIERTIAAIIENYVNKDGDLEIPKILEKYIFFKKI